MHKFHWSLPIIGLFTLIALNCNAQLRQQTELSKGWKTIASDSVSNAYDGFENSRFDDSQWTSVDVPHNWDQYEGYRRNKHGNRHGYSWYRTNFTINKKEKNKQYFLYFEGVGSYATVWLNGVKVGTHAGGRTTFTIDITEAINSKSKTQLLAVKADHPASIRDLPWVCGGCSPEWGFSEGSQPMGIFRPVSLITTNKIRIEPFGVHAWNDTTVTEQSATINLTTEVKNYNTTDTPIEVISTIKDKAGKTISSASTSTKVKAGETTIVPQEFTNIKNITLWSPQNPYLYTITSEVKANGKTIDSETTNYGIRYINWPISRTNANGQFLINGKPFFINGTAEYEHNMGMSHAFTTEQIKARVMQMKAAGYNAFRDAHQPHNLRYHPYWDESGMLWWPQFAAHIWFDNNAFKENFKTLLRDWMKERRNSPSIILWGLENESTLPIEFAQECTQIIREMDPTAYNQRLVTTCNGGVGTDWNVVQNWSGTYGGDPNNYGNEISKQWLNGEYGAWRSIDLHTEGEFEQNGVLSEDRMTLLMEKKIKEAEGAKDSCSGQFHWIFASHENPGRVQNGEGWRDIDRIGPVNYKGLLTPWGEPLDVFYMFRANYAPKSTDPMVYIVSQTWPNRWSSPGIKNGINVYSNCDEVELFNDTISLGKKTNMGIGTHFTWNNVNIQSNLLRAVGYVNGQVKANDEIVLHNLPQASMLKSMKVSSNEIITPAKDYRYIYRVNCGGPALTDHQGNNWSADIHLSDSAHWGSTSWTDNFKGIPHFYGSQRRIFNPIEGTKEWELFQSFRYGRHQLKYHFPVTNGEYLVELYFTEPWYGIDGNTKSEGWRIFDVQINDNIIKDTDIAKECGGAQKALKKTTLIKVTNGKIEIAFPNVKVGQAVISAIAIATKNNATAATASPFTISTTANNKISTECWLDWGSEIFTDNKENITDLPPVLFAAQWIKTPTFEKSVNISASCEADLFIAIDSTITSLPEYLKEFKFTQSMVKTNLTTYAVYSHRVAANSRLEISNLGNTKWFIAANPVFTLEQAADQRPISKYEAEDALPINPLAIQTLSDRGITILSSTNNKQIEWKINTGVADTYALRIKARNATDKNIKAVLTLSTFDGIELKRETVEFIPTKEGWKTMKTTTGTTINAGLYIVRLKALEDQQLEVDYLEIQ